MLQYCRRSRQKEKSIEIKLTQKGQENHYDVKYLHGYGSQKWNRENLSKEALTRESTVMKLKIENLALFCLNLRKTINF